MTEFRLDSSAQQWLDSHPGPWSLVQSAELAELRARVAALQGLMATVVGSEINKHDTEWCGYCFDLTAEEYAQIQAAARGEEVR